MDGLQGLERKRRVKIDGSVRIAWAPTPAAGDNRYPRLTALVAMRKLKGAAQDEGRKRP